MKSEMDLYLAIEKIKDRYDKQKAKARRYTILVMTVLIYFFWLKEDFSKTLDYFTGILEAIVMSYLFYFIAIFILMPTMTISEHEKDEIDRLKRDFQSYDE